MKKIIVDTKCTIWYRGIYYVEDSCPTDDLIVDIENGSIQQHEGEYILDTVADMYPISNNGESTLEIRMDSSENEPFYTNRGKVYLEEIADKMEVLAQFIRRY